MWGPHPLWVLGAPYSKQRSSWGALRAPLLGPQQSHFFLGQHNRLNPGSPRVNNIALSRGVNFRAPNGNFSGGRVRDHERALGHRSFPRGRSPEPIFLVHTNHSQAWSLSSNPRLPRSLLLYLPTVRAFCAKALGASRKHVCPTILAAFPPKSDKQRFWGSQTYLRGVPGGIPNFLLQPASFQRPLLLRQSSWPISVDKSDCAPAFLLSPHLTPKGCLAKQKNGRPRSPTTRVWRRPGALSTTSATNNKLSSRCLHDE